MKNALRSWDVWKPLVLSHSRGGVRWTQRSHYTATSGSTRYFCLYLLIIARGLRFPTLNFAFSDLLLCVCLQCRCSLRGLHLTPLSRPPSRCPWWARPRQACLCQERPPLATRETTASWSRTPIGWNRSSVLILFSCLYFTGLNCVSPPPRLLYFRSSAEVSLDPVVSQGSAEEPSQQSDKSNMPSTSQEPSTSSAGNVFRAYISDALRHLLLPALTPSSLLKTQAVLHRKLPGPGPADSCSAGQNTAVAAGREEVTGRQERDNSRDVNAVPTLLMSRQRQITVENRGILWHFRRIIQPVYLFYSSTARICSDIFSVDRSGLSFPSREKICKMKHWLIQEHILPRVEINLTSSGSRLSLAFCFFKICL